jgi:hypothetical protein
VILVPLAILLFVDYAAVRVDEGQCERVMWGYTAGGGAARTSSPRVSLGLLSRAASGRSHICTNGRVGYDGQRVRVRVLA